MYENRKMTPIKVAFKREEKEIRKSRRRVNAIKVHHMHVWKYHSETLLHN
jgi:hypothetical protein